MDRPRAHPVGRSIMLRIGPVTALLDTSMILAYLGCTRYYNLMETIVLNDLTTSVIPQRMVFAAWLFKIPLVRRSVFSAFHHRRLVHLLLDLAWTLVIGIELEKSLGSLCFLGDVAMMYTISQGFSALLNTLLVFLMNYSERIKYRHSVGFSGVLFGLTVVRLSSLRTRVRRSRRRRLLSPSDVLIVSVTLLIFMRWLAPDASVADNIAGILAGFLHMNTPLRPNMGGFVVWVLAAYNEAVRALSSLFERSFWGGEADEIDDGQEGVDESMVEEQEIGRRGEEADEIDDGQEGVDESMVEEPEGGRRGEEADEIDDGQEGDDVSMIAEQERGRRGEENVEDSREGRNPEAPSPRQGRNEVFREEDQDPAKEEEELDERLEWRCRHCSSKNGVFFATCDECRSPRHPNLRSPRHFSAHHNTSNRVPRFPAPSPQMQFCGERHTPQLRRYNDVPQTPSAPSLNLLESTDYYYK